MSNICNAKVFWKKCKIIGNNKKRKERFDHDVQVFFINIRNGILLFLSLRNITFFYLFIKFSLHEEIQFTVSLSTMLVYYPNSYWALFCFFRLNYDYNPRISTQ